MADKEAPRSQTETQTLRRQPSWKRPTRKLWRAGRTEQFLLEGIDSERGIAWRASDSLAVRAFLRLPVAEPPPDHTTISRTRRVIDLESHRAVFTWSQS